MLSERERLALHEIERRIADDDPELRRRFAKTCLELDRQPRRRQLPYILAIAISALLLVLGIVVQSSGMIVLMAIVTGGCVGVWYYRFKRETHP